MPNKFQTELAARNRIINGREWHWQKSVGQRVPVELVVSTGGAVHRNDILTTLDQRAFAMLDEAGARRRDAAQRYSEKRFDRAEIHKDEALALIRSARKARLAAEVRARIFHSEAA